MPDSNITKKALAQAMKSLMARENFSKISVSDICKECGMNRKSFYYHFKDKYDLVNWIFQTEFLESIQAVDYPNGWKFMEDICTYFYREQRFYRNALMIEGQNSFRTYFSEVIRPFLAIFSDDLFHSSENSEFYITFFSDALLVSIIRWLTEGAKIPPEEYLMELRKIIVGLAKKVLSDLGTENSESEKTP